MKGAGEDRECDSGGAVGPEGTVPRRPGLQTPQTMHRRVKPLGFHKPPDPRPFPFPVLREAYLARRTGSHAGRVVAEAGGLDTRGLSDYQSAVRLGQGSTVGCRELIARQDTSLHLGRDSQVDGTTRRLCVGGAGGGEGVVMEFDRVEVAESGGTAMQGASLAYGGRVDAVLDEVGGADEDRTCGGHQGNGDGACGRGLSAE